MYETMRNPQKTYKGNQAGHYLDGASVLEMRAGNFEIVSPALGEYQTLGQTDDGNLVIMDGGRALAVLECDDATTESLDNFVARRSEAFRNAN